MTGAAQARLPCSSRHAGFVSWQLDWEAILLPRVWWPAWPIPGGNITGRFATVPPETQP